ncbi:MAG TPA: GDP-L-fucose synthase [Candidatus Acidoferrum sp.]|nr:GDP-L-fucose synthase [Candidatus Acidoferrum sp.]
MNGALSLGDARVLVTGGAGFLGRTVVARLQTAGCSSVVIPRRAQYDLTREADVERLFAEHPVDLVLHLAADVGGIGYNLANPGRTFYANTMMGALVMEQARRTGVRKLVAVGSVCAYPEHARVPFREDEVWDGYPEPTNGAYGSAKRMLLVQGQAYRAQYGFCAIHLLMMNLYGPGDHFDPERSHVIPALIRRFLEAAAAGTPEIVVWGDGLATREFLFVDDAARGILLAAERYDEAAPVNLGAGFEISIRDLAGLLAELTGYRGRVVFDASKPSGQRRRCADVTRARDLFGFRAEVGFREGLTRTIEWYARTQGAGAAR